VPVLIGKIIYCSIKTITFFLPCQQRKSKDKALWIYAIHSSGAERVETPKITHSTLQSILLAYVVNVIAKTAANV